MTNRFAQDVTKRFDDEIRFFKTWIDKPKALGAFLPTSGVTARRMACLINPANGAPVLELGPGTGVITKAILELGIKPEKLFSVEYTEDFIEPLKSNYPGVNVLHGDAFNLGSVLPDMDGEKFDTIISAIPLLNFPTSERISYLDGLLDLLTPGRPVVQMSYGPGSPIPPNRGRYSIEPFDWILRNVPPARLWVYRRVGTS